jgi:hypothetical protein
MKKRLGSLEFRYQEFEDRDAEIVTWDSNDTGEFCYSLLFWRKDREGYYVEFVGSRPLDQIHNHEHLWKLIRYGQSVLDATYELEHSYP